MTPLTAESRREKSVPTTAAAIRAAVGQRFAQVARWAGYRTLSFTEAALVTAGKGMA
jgi:hypothetical protein